MSLGNDRWTVPQIPTKVPDQVRPFPKKPIIFRDMRTQGEHNAEVRLSISCPSAEETESQIYLLKKTDLSFRNVHVLERPKRN